ncbi:homeobox-leucine zipper protein HOX18-like [Triticum dicoccoides]|uniref:homeobox-leucine zipper protein HOX18-like n=1 Tax=Triticum dicoccoides TaxID=85692 RepID=UPI00189167EC|nr:homeobox-leucine zipper protein HOX18-like [Triticum dicoccoides]
MERQDLGAWLGLATGGGAAWHIHDGKRRTGPVQLDALFPQHGKEERDQDEQKTGGKGARRKIKVGGDDEGRSSSSNGPCLSDGGGSDDAGGGRRKKLRLTKEQCALLEGSFRAHNILSHVQKQELARQLNLTSRQVEVWFQNRRARTKLKQTEVDCEFLKRWCESLTHENQRLKHELLELRRSTAASVAASTKLFAQLPRAAAMVNLCPSCEKVAVNN